MTKRLRILHLSDLHVGKESAADSWRVERVMGKAWARNLREIAADGPIDLVCFTGDLAQRGKPQEYDGVRTVIDAVLQSLGCPRERFFCVPGNHDIDRDIAPEAWSALRELQGQDSQDLSRWMAGGRPPSRCDAGWREGILRRQQAYRDFLAAADLPHLLPERSPHGRLGYRCTLDLGAGAPLHIVGFDSAWLAGDDNDAGKLRLGDDQIGRLLTADGTALPGWRIGLIHHPLTDLADARDAQRRLGEYSLDLLLHGHQHDPVIERWSDPQAGLHVFAAGCLYEHQRYPNGLLVVDVDLTLAQPLRPRQVWARRWSHRVAEWIDDNELYRGTRNGRLPLAADGPAPFAAAPGEFVGRDVELQALRAALLPDARAGAAPRPTAICCAIDGMPGVGKTRLAEQFITDDWLRVYPPPPGTPVGEAVLRIVLPSGADQSDLRSADTLLRELADRLRLQGTIDDLRRDLPAALRHGPGAHPRLLLIENVDSVAQAEQVASLVHGLPGCAVLVTARVRQCGGPHWKRIGVKPLQSDDAATLLRNEAEATGDGAFVPTVFQARQLVETLGRLPLALHIAASHLGLGTTPDEFLAELRATGLDLAPAQPGDHGLGVDRARAILRSSFELSWKAWCAGSGAGAAWQEALVALAHGPADGVGESLGAAITKLPAVQYGPCLVAAGRLSLLEWTWAGDGEAHERRVRLHALIAEFLRTRRRPAAKTVTVRMGAWFAPRVSDASQDTMGQARRELHTEPGGLLQWLGATRLDETALRLISATHYAVDNGPYGAWLTSFRAGLPKAGETQRGLDLAWAVARLAQRSGDPLLAMETAQMYAERAKRLENDGEYAIAQGQIADILQAQGALDEALRLRREEELPVYERLGDVRSRAITQGKIADILEVRGELDEALRLRREEQIPVYERLGDVRSRAITQGQIADILQARGELDEALRLRREEQMPVYERLGDVRSRAITQGKIANILQARGELEEALRIQREEQIPVFERLGDVRERAIAQGKIANILQARGELEEALRLRREEEMPVYERLGDVRSQAITLGKIADILEARGKLDEALRLRREEQMPVYERLGDVRSLLIGRANLAMALAKRGRPEDRPEMLTLLQQALTDAERLRLPEAATIRGQIARIFSAGDGGTPAA